MTVFDSLNSVYIVVDVSSSDAQSAFQDGLDKINEMFPGVKFEEFVVRFDPARGVNTFSAHYSRPFIPVAYELDTMSPGV
jgi:hypothetical protein